MAKVKVLSAPQVFQTKKDNLVVAVVGMLLGSRGAHERLVVVYLEGKDVPSIGKAIEVSELPSGNLKYFGKRKR